MNAFLFVREKKVQEEKLKQLSSAVIVLLLRACAHSVCHRKVFFPRLNGWKCVHQPFRLYCCCKCSVEVKEANVEFYKSSAVYIDEKR
jgi:hypothetical protein